MTYYYRNTTTGRIVKRETPMTPVYRPWVRHSPETETAPRERTPSALLPADILADIAGRREAGLPCCSPDCIGEPELHVAHFPEDLERVPVSAEVQAEIDGLAHLSVEPAVSDSAGLVAGDAVTDRREVLVAPPRNEPVSDAPPATLPGSKPTRAPRAKKAAKS